MALDKSDLDKQNEALSAMMDNELSPSELDDTVTGLLSATQISDLKQKWQRYHMISDALQKHIPEKVACNLADRVMSELENEPVVLAPNRIAAIDMATKKETQTASSISLPTRSVYKQIAGLAVAASVMVVAIMVTQTFSTQDGVNPTTPIAALTPSTSIIKAIIPVTPPPAMPSQQQFARVSAEPQKTLPPSFQNQLNRYLANHNQYASGVSGVLPYARLIGFTSAQPTPQQK